LLLGTIALIALLGAPAISLADAGPCDTQNLNRDDQSRLQAAARATLPRSARLVISGVCVNSRDAHALVATAKSLAANGAEQWREVLCRREELDWQCDPMEFKQRIKLSLAVGNQSHAVEVIFGKDTTPTRATALAAQALNIYVDPASRLPGCAITGAKDRALVDGRRGGELPQGVAPIHVTLSRDGVIESIFLDDVAVAIEFPADADEVTKPQAACWNDVVLVS
jgi:hypothetical protein